MSGRGTADEARLLDTLAAAGHLDGGRRRVIEREHAAAAGPLEELLVDAGFVDAATLARFVPDASRIDLDAEDLVPDERAVACLDAAAAHRWQVVPIALDVTAEGAAATLVLAAAGEADLPRRDAVRRALPSALAVAWRVASASGVARALDRCYGVGLGLDDVVAACDAEAEGGGRGGVAAPGAALPPIARLVDALLADAVARRASDIHLSPEERFVRVRYRIDGVLADARCLQRRHLDALVVRVKVLAGTDIAETRRPQDGRFSRRVRGRRVDFRFSSFPLRTGENLVLRVLERRAAAPGLDALAQPPALRDVLRRLVHRPDGLVVVCGPTGAGKTTTLYALLGERDTDALNVMTLEDPIEHPTVGVRQASIDAARGLDYAGGVRALLRQDPDVLLIGEVRDGASCAMALRAALTGHQVLTTVHAGDALGALGRLRELGAAPGTLADVLVGVVAQRLVRVRCPACDGRGAPCTRCAGHGLHGRRAVLETLVPGEAFRTLLRADADGAALAAQAARDGHETLRARAAALVAAGVTTAAETVRVFGPEDGDGPIGGTCRDARTGAADPRHAP